jgi:hypothetical protein
VSSADRSGFDYLYSSGAGERAVSLAGEENTLDFNTPNMGLLTPMPPPKHPAEDDAPAGSDWDMEKMTIGPARSGPAGPASGVDLETGLMAAELHWKI